MGPNFDLWVLIHPNPRNIFMAFGIAYSPLNSANLSCSNEVTYWTYLTHIIWQLFDSVHYFLHFQRIWESTTTKSVPLQHNYCATVIPKRPNLYYYEWRTTPCYAPKMCDRLCHIFHWIVFDCVLITISKSWWVY